MLAAELNIRKQSLYICSFVSFEMVWPDSEPLNTVSD